MNTPTHILCGACLAQALAQTCAKGLVHGRLRIMAVGAAALGIGIASHLLLDLLPHYAWVVYLDWFKPLPFHWLIREAVFGIAVAIPAFIFAGRTWPFVALGMLGGLYPDFEKVLSVDFHIPDRFILFDWHSTYLSTRRAGLPNAILTGFECVLIAGFLFAMWRMNRSRAKNEL